jgi:3-phenylpropionate/cinnamic acid dioxygenase small subunit
MSAAWTDHPPAHAQSSLKGSIVPLQALDYQHITDILVRSNLALDQADIDAWVACFTKDGVFQIADASGAVVTRCMGDQELRDYATRAARSSYGAGVSRRWNGNLLIAGDRDGADVRSYLIVATMGRAQQVIATGIVHDRVRKVGDAWLLEERSVSLDNRLP